MPFAMHYKPSNHAARSSCHGGSVWGCVICEQHPGEMLCCLASHNDNLQQLWLHHQPEQEVQLALLQPECPA